jgi:hypothetical protein
MMTAEILGYIPFDEYVAIDRMNWSRLSLMVKSPFHVAQYRPKPPTESQAFGTAAHAMLLEPDTFEQRFLRGPNGPLNKNPGKAEWDACKAEAEANGMVPLKGDHWDACMVARDRVWSHPAASMILQQAAARETAVVWEDHGVLCKCRPDLWTTGRLLVDCKTTVDPSPDGFERSMGKYGYHCQLAFYGRGLRANGIDVAVESIIAIENEWPHAVAVHEIEPAAIAQGNRMIDSYLSGWRLAVEKGVFEAYPGVSVLGLSKWEQDPEYAAMPDGA